MTEQRRKDIEWLESQEMPLTIQIPLNTTIKLSYNEFGLVVIGKPETYLERLESLYFDLWHQSFTTDNIHAKIRLAKVGFRLNELNQKDQAIKTKTKSILESRIKELTKISKNYVTKDTKKSPDTEKKTRTNVNIKKFRIKCKSVKRKVVK